MSPKQGCDRGWARLTELTTDRPEHKEGGSKCHVSLHKKLRGEYLSSFMSGRDHPVLHQDSTYGKRQRTLAFGSNAEFLPGSKVKVSYPNVKSKKIFAATVMDYNPLLSKPYYIVYEEGNTVEYVVPRRIRGEMKGTTVEEGGVIGGNSEAQQAGERKRRRGRAAKQGFGKEGKEEEEEEEKKRPEDPVIHDLFTAFAPG